MSLLEDRILRIIELRQKGYGDNQIAEDLDIDEETVTLYERTTKKVIQDSITAKHRGLEEIAGNIGLSSITLGLFATHYDIQISEKKKELSRTRQKTLDEINQAIAEGAKSPTEVAKKIGKTPCTIRKYMGEEDVNLSDFKRTGQGKSKEERLTEIQEAIAEGAEYTDDIAEKLGISPYTVYYSYKDELSKRGINLPPLRKKLYEYINPKRVLERDRLIAQGLTLKEIAEQDTVSGERIRQYAVATEQDEIRKQAKEKRKEKEKERQEYLSRISTQILLAGRENSTEDEKWAYDIAMRYISKPFGRKECYSKLLKLLEIKRRAEKKGTKLTLEEYQELTGIGFTRVGRIFSKLGLEPDYGVKDRHITPKWKKQAMERAIPVPLTSGCIAHLLKLPSHIVSLHFNRYSKRKNQRPKTKYSIAVFKDKKHLTYSKASQIYEATDSEPDGCEFSDNETIELLNTSQEVIDYAREHRTEIEAPILEGLKTLYPNKDITRPYLNFKID